MTEQTTNAVFIETSLSTANTQVEGTQQDGVPVISNILSNASNFPLQDPRKRFPTEKGFEQKISQLKGNKTSALRLVTRKRTDITKLMSDDNNLHLVKTELSNFNTLFEQFQIAFESYCEILDEREQEHEYSSYDNKERSVLEFRRIVMDWIVQSEKHTADQLDSQSEHSSCTTKISKSSSKASRSSSVARASEKAKLAELQAEKSFLKKRQELQFTKEEFRLDLEIAKAQARERAYAEAEKEGFDSMNRYLVKDNQSDGAVGLVPSSPRPPTSLTTAVSPLSLPRIPILASPLQISSLIRPPISSTPTPQVPQTPGQEYSKNAPVKSKINTSVLEKASRHANSSSSPNINAAPIFSPSTVPKDGSLSYHKIPREIPDPSNHLNPDLSTINQQTMQDILVMQQQQNIQMIETHRQLAAAMTLPQPEVPKFKGDPINYRTFVRSFDARIEARAVNDADRLYYLEQLVEGEPKDLIGGCLYMNPDEGYKEARRLLEREYGDAYKIAMAHVTKALQWQVIKADDAVGLKHFSFFLKKCKSAMNGVSHMAVLNHSPNLQTIIQKLPIYLQGKWRDRVLKMRRLDKQIEFADLVEFIDYSAEAANDPVYSKDALSKKEDIYRLQQGTNYKKGPTVANPKGTSFATSINMQDIKPSSNHCPLCTKDHSLEDCYEFLERTVEERKVFLMDNRLCFACFGIDHISKGCTKKKICATCGKRHPTVLHIEGFNIKGNNPKKDVNVDKVSNGCIEVPSSSCNKTSTGQTMVLHAILPVRVKSKGSDKSVVTYAFLDNGSGGCFATDGLMKQLGLKGVSTTLQLGTMHGQSYVDSTILDDLSITDLEDNNKVELPKVYTREEIPVNYEQIPTPEIVSRWKHLKEIASKIPQYDPSLEIGLLIGSNCPAALEPLEVVPGRGNGPFAVRHRHGWTVNGPLKITFDHDTIKITTNRISVEEVSRVKEIISPESLLKMFELDFNDHALAKSPDDLAYSQEDKRFIAEVEKGTRHLDGHYNIPLVFKQPNRIAMPDNRKQALNRALWQKKKMLKQNNSKYRADYIAFVNDIIAKGYAEKVPFGELEGEPGKVWFIPHFGVYHPKKPEKIRVVFDCSAKFQGVSLNDLLIQGPDLTNSLFGVLTRFRQEPIALMADVEAMFHQVRVPVEQCNLLRFFWWPNGDLNSEPEEYRMRVHLFGAVSSPSCANFALKQAADDCEEEYGEFVANTLRHNFYVDDCLRSVRTEDTAISLIKDLQQSCAKGGFHLTKFTSNSRRVLESVPEEERSKEVRSMNLDCDDLPVERALGVQWCIESDSFGFHIIVSDKPITRRGILSTVSSVYDPLGFAAPFILPAKKLLQDLCLCSGLGWDDEIPEKYRSLWSKWLSELPLLEDLKINRCVKPLNFGQIVSREIHVFSDASSIGYGSVAYLRIQDDRKQIHCAFLTGKARLAPLKPLTIPRLELVAATISVRLVQMLMKELNNKPDRIVYHTDSTTVLRYIANEQKRFQLFVANRIQLIRNSSDIAQWRYVDTKENPADDASRGIDGQAFLKDQRWLTGPEFLWRSEKTWSPQPFTMGKIPDNDPEVKKMSICAVTIDNSRNPTIELIKYYSDWYRLKKAVAVFLRLRKILLSRVSRKKMSQVTTSSKAQYPKAFTVQELEEAEISIIKYVQNQNFGEEITTFQHNGSGALKKTSFIYRLDPFLHKGVLRVGGRLNKADLPEAMRNPVILPRKNHITSLVIRSIHKQLGHAGRGHVMSTLREKYWVISANSEVRSELFKCVPCRRYQASPTEQKMADLPKNRVTPAPPFTFVGVDYFGPYVIKEGRKELKRYGALFTCLVSRAIHIEVATSLDTDSFINALRRFIARRGPVREIRSDNGSNFVGAERELKQCIQEMDHNQIHDKLCSNGTDWIFNPPTASHMGGVWERQIRTVRKILSGLLHEHGTRLDVESFSTLLCEVEAIVNSRPLTFVSNDPDDLNPLAPSHLLTGKSNIILPPPGQFQRNDIYMRRRWRRVQHLANLFWTRWKKEYLVTLQNRDKWNKQRRSMKTGDVVILKEDNVVRNQWPMGVVTSTEPDSKGLVRSVMVKTSTSVLRRPVNKLVLLLPSDQ